VPTLERIGKLVAAMGDPQRSFPSIHVTGTNGKGSTARMSAALLGTSGIQTGLYTSPHLERINERLVARNLEITDDALAAQLAALAELEVFVGMRATWFELVTATALRWFADEAVEAAVVEVGLGGRWDATNVVDGEVAVVTNVELDHVQLLGGTRGEIAAEKAGIVKPGSVVILGEEDPEIGRIVEDEAVRVGAAAVWRRGVDFGAAANRLAYGGRVVDLHTPARRYDEVFIPLHGAHQADNAAAALAAVQAFVGAPIEESVVTEAFAGLEVPGRLEVVRRRPLVVLDGAHNPAGAVAAGKALVEDFSACRKVIVVMGCLRGHGGPAAVLESLGLAALDPARRGPVLACTAPSPRSVPGSEVREAAETLGLEAEEAGSVAEALARAVDLADPDDLILVTGSLYVVGEARTVMS
jgi:dihydrofolate synthase/folylpolyglutamate synthase